MKTCGYLDLPRGDSPESAPGPEKMDAKNFQQIVRYFMTFNISLCTNDL